MLGYNLQHIHKCTMYNVMTAEPLGFVAMLRENRSYLCSYTFIRKNPCKGQNSFLKSGPCGIL